MLNGLREKGFGVGFESHAYSILANDFPSALADLEAVLVGFEIPVTEIIGSGGGETKGTQRLRKALDAKGWRKTKFEIHKTIRLTEAGARSEPVQVERESTSHEIDHVKTFKGDFAGNRLVALEIEWNNKDPFFDRDLENFKRLHAEGAISVGIIVTRGTDLHDSMRDFVRRYAAQNKIQSFEDLNRLGISITPKQESAIAARTMRAKNSIDFGDAWTEKFVADKYGEATTHWRKLISRIERGVGNPCPLLLIGLPASIVKFDVDPSIDPVEAEEDGEA
jgi:hypothetical protein